MSSGSSCILRDSNKTRCRQRTTQSIRPLRAFSLLLCTVKPREVRLFLRKSHVGSGCSVYTRSENALAAAHGTENCHYYYIRGGISSAVGGYTATRAMPFTSDPPLWGKAKKLPRRFVAVIGQLEVDEAKARGSRMRIINPHDAVPIRRAGANFVIRRRVRVATHGDAPAGKSAASDGKGAYRFAPVALQHLAVA